MNDYNEECNHIEIQPYNKGDDYNQSDEYGNIEEVIERLTKEEVYRLRRNLGALDALEIMLMDNIKTQLHLMGRVDNATLMDVIKTFNNSVKRSTDVIKGNTAGSLVQILVNAQEEAHVEQYQETKQQEENSKQELTLDGRKRVRALLSAIIDEENDINNGKDDENE